jgi:hypothetical protein
VPKAGDPVDARDLPEDPAALGTVLEERFVFGRVTPHQKESMVKALQARGHTVAMTGDGVNDVLALKLADIGVAMGSGAAATKAVAELVLLDNGFGTLPGVVAEGRRVTANIERVANLFITKTVWATLLAVAAGAALIPYPFLPRHLTIIDTLAIGSPPSSSRSRRTGGATGPGSSAGCCGSPFRPGSSSPPRRSRRMPWPGRAAFPWPSSARPRPWSPSSSACASSPCWRCR